MRILILEDNKQRIESFRRSFKQHTLDIVEHADDAIQLLKDNEYGLIFLDHDLGGLEMEWKEEDCGMRVAVYMAENNIKTKTYVHSYNNVRGPIMANMIPNGEYRPGAWIEYRSNQ